MPANYLHADFFQKRDTESQIAFEMRVRPYLSGRAEAQAEADQGHAEYRKVQDARTTGEGVGLGGLETSPHARAQALGNRGFGSGREIERNGSLAWEASPLQP